MKTEKWRPIIGFYGLYEVSDQGRVKSLARTLSLDRIDKGGRRSVRERILSRKRVGRYAYVSLSMNGVVKTALVHRLVLEAFVGPCPDGMQCRHFPDRDGHNNSLKNLSWGTPTENQADRFVHKTDDRGKRKKRRLTKAVELEIRSMYGKPTQYRRGEITQRELANIYGISLSLVNNIVRNKQRAGD